MYHSHNPGGRIVNANRKKSSTPYGYKNNIFIVLLGISMCLIAQFSSADEGAKTAIQKSFEKVGVSEKDSIQIAEFANILFDGVREYSRGFAQNPAPYAHQCPTQLNLWWQLPPI